MQKKHLTFILVICFAWLNTTKSQADSKAQLKQFSACNPILRTYDCCWYIFLCFFFLYGVREIKCGGIKIKRTTGWMEKFAKTTLCATMVRIVKTKMGLKRRFSNQDLNGMLQCNGFHWETYKFMIHSLPLLSQYLYNVII